MGANYKLPYSSLKKSDYLKMKIDENGKRACLLPFPISILLGKTKQDIHRKYSKNDKEMQWKIRNLSTVV